MQFNFHFLVEFSNGKIGKRNKKLNNREIDSENK